MDPLVIGEPGGKGLPPRAKGPKGKGLKDKGAPPPHAKERMERRKERRERWKDLTPEQKEAYQKLKGDPFEM